MLEIDEDNEISEAELPIGLEVLPVDAIASIMQHLSVYDVLSCMLVSRAMRIAVKDERVWATMCKPWAEFTTIQRWIITDEQLRNRQAWQGCLPSPKNYR
jgi:hypothetical protein